MNILKWFVFLSESYREEYEYLLIKQIAANYPVSFTLINIFLITK